MSSDFNDDEGGVNMKLHTTIQLFLTVEELSALKRAQVVLTEACNQIEEEIGCGGCPLKNQCETPNDLLAIIDLAEIQEKE